MVSIDSLTLFHKSMYVMTQFHYYPHNLATMKVSKLQILFVTSTQTEEHVASFKFLKCSIFIFSHLDICLYYRNICIIHGLTPILTQN